MTSRTNNGAMASTSRTRCARRSSIVVTLALAASGSAQTAQFQWHVSTDEGASWQGGAVQVPQTQASVLVRGRLAWTPDAAVDAFHVTALDVVVTNCGPGDSVSAWRRLVQGGLSDDFTGFLSAFRFGSTIKIDRSTDALPPGLGPEWIRPGNSSPFVVGFNMSNPIDLIEYRLHLDGTPGTRACGQVFLLQPNSIQIYRDFGTGELAFLPTSDIPGSVTVLPTPGAIALLALGGVVAARRRRRR